MLIKNLKINNSNEFNLKNNKNIDKLPINEEISILYILTFLLNIIEVDKSNIKSNIKLITSSKSKYILIYITSTFLIIKKQHYK